MLPRAPVHGDVAGPDLGPDAPGRERPAAVKSARPSSRSSTPGRIARDWRARAAVSVTGSVHLRAAAEPGERQHGPGLLCERTGLGKGIGGPGTRRKAHGAGPTGTSRLNGHSGGLHRPPSPGSAEKWPVSSHAAQKRRAAWPVVRIDDLSVAPSLSAAGMRFSGPARTGRLGGTRRSAVPRPRDAADATQADRSNPRSSGDPGEPPRGRTRTSPRRYGAGGGGPWPGTANPRGCLPTGGHGLAQAPD